MERVNSCCLHSISVVGCDSKEEPTRTIADHAVRDTVTLLILGFLTSTTLSSLPVVTAQDAVVAQDGATLPQM